MDLRIKNVISNKKQVLINIKQETIHISESEITFLSVFIDLSICIHRLNPYHFAFELSVN